jgi:hypothetical protein
MQKVISAFVFLILFSIASTAQDKKELDLFLKNEDIPKTAKDYYKGKFKAADDAKTFSILDSIGTNNPYTRQFYLYLATQMMEKSDGALSEELGVRTKEYLEQHPNWALAFLQGSLATPSFNSIWAQKIAGEIMIDCEGKEKQCAKVWYEKTLKKTNTQYKSTLKALYLQVSTQCP